MNYYDHVLLYLSLLKANFLTIQKLINLLPFNLNLHGMTLLPTPSWLNSGSALWCFLSYKRIFPLISVGFVASATHTCSIKLPGIVIYCNSLIFVHLNFTLKIFVVKNFRQYFILKFLCEEKFKMRKIFR